MVDITIRDAVAAALADIHLTLIGPELIVAGVGLLALVLEKLVGRRHQATVGYVCIAGMVLAGLYLQLGSLPALESGPSVGFAGLFVLDGFAIFFKVLFLVATGLVMLMSMRYLDEEREHRGEYYSLLCFATLGMMIMVSGRDLITIFVGLELMALTIYVLVGFLRDNLRSNEAAMKYFVLGAFSSAFFLYGISLFYGVTGTTTLEGIRASLVTQMGNPLATLGLIMMAVGLGFKVAAVPFHAWAPDAYEGAPTPITAYVSVASKAAAFAIMMRILLVGLVDLSGKWSLLLTVLAIASMTLGNLVALVQDNVKRMLAYSSIAHAGYALIGVLAAGTAVPLALDRQFTLNQRWDWSEDLQQWAQGGVLVYLFAYTFMNIGAFALVTYLRRRSVVGDDIRDFAGLAKRSPWFAVAMTVFLLSLGGIPLTAGFVGKFLLFGAAIKARLYTLAIVAVLNTAVSLYFYLRIVVMMWMENPRADQPAYALSPHLVATVATAVFVTLLVGVWPQRLLELAQNSILVVGSAAQSLAIY